MGSTRMLFRMKYQPCNGMCYCADEVLDLASVPEADRAALVSGLIAIHEPACGNDRVRYALDLDEGVGLFIASMIVDGELTLYTSRSPAGALADLIAGAQAFWATEHGKQIAALGDHDVCEHGKDQDLVAFCYEHGLRA